MYIDKKTKYDPDYRTGESNTSNEPSDAYRIVGMWNGRIDIENDENGAKFSITDSNLMYIMDHSAIENKTFQTKCVMVKEGTKTVLLPEGSELYETAMERMNRPNAKLTPGKVFILEMQSGEQKEMLYLGSFYKVYLRVPKKDREIKSSGKIIFREEPYDFRGSYRYFYFMSLETGEIFCTGDRNSFVILDKLYDNIEGYETKDERFMAVRDFLVSKRSKKSEIKLPSSKKISYNSSKETRKSFFKENNIKIKD